MKKALSILALALSTVSGSAQTPEDMVRGDILTGWRSTDGTHMTALRLRLAPGWKTYWRSPGDAGIPPQFDWETSRNINAVELHWPVPDVFWQNGMRSVGYENTVVLPITIQPELGTEDIAIDGTVEIGVCEEICVPVTLAIRAILPPDATGPDARIAKALADQPMTAGEGQLRGVDCDLTPTDDGLRLTANIEMPRLGKNEEVVIETADPTLWVSDGRAERTGQVLTTTVEIVPPDLKPFPLARNDLQFTVLAAGQAVSVKGCS